MMTYATVTGRIVVPGTDDGIPGQLHAIPMTNGEILAFPDDDTLTLGPAVAEVAADGTLSQDGTPGLKVPAAVPAGTVWQLKFHGAGRRKLPVNLGVYEITADTTTGDLVAVTPVAISPTVASNIEAAAALGATNDTATASFVTDVGSATHAALSATYVRGGSTNDPGVVELVLPTATPSTTELAWTATTQPVWPLSVGTDGLLYGSYRPDDLLFRTADGAATALDYSSTAFTASPGVQRWVGRVAEGYGLLMGDSTGGEFWFSTDWETGWTKTATFGPVGNLSRPIPVDTPTGTVMLVGEYITNTFPSAARKLWLSRNGGQTWTAVRDSLLSDTGVNSHWHAANYDPLRGRIWASQGDGVNAWFGYSDDWGATWVGSQTPTTSPIYDGIAYQQPTVLGHYGDALILTPDRGNFPTGVWMADADTGHTEIAFELPSGEMAHTQYGVGLAQQGQEIYLSFSDEGGSGSGKTYIVGSGDGGRSWHLLSTMDAPSGSLREPLIGVAGGYLYIKATGHPTYGNAMLRAQAPTWS